MKRPWNYYEVFVAGCDDCDRKQRLGRQVRLRCLRKNMGYVLDENEVEVIMNINRVQCRKCLRKR